MNGIMFKSPVWKGKLRALAEYGEAQTRRLSGLKEINLAPDDWEMVSKDVNHFLFGNKTTKEAIFLKSRYHVGEIVYVKEAWKTLSDYDHLKPSQIPDNAEIWFTDENGFNPEWKMPGLAGRARSPMFLRAVHARHFLQITDVIPDRPHLITYEDALKEGCGDLGIIPVNTAMLMTGTDNLDDMQAALTIAQYHSLWDSINPQNPISSKPWDWKITFKEVPRPL